jgi:two-component system cell cycle response regulator DivK
MPDRAAVLLVGNDDATEMYSEFLIHHGWQITISRSANDAITQLPVVCPAVIITDLIVDGSLQLGCELITAIRQHPAGNEPIVFVVTGYVRDADRALARRCGADRFFIKPLLPDALLHEVERGLAQFRQGRRPEWNGPTIDVDRRRRPRRSTDPQR